MKMLDDLEPNRRRQVVRNGVRETFAIITLAMALGLWLGIQTNVPYVDVSPQIEMLLDTIAAMSFGAAGFLVWGKRSIEEGMDLLNKFRGG